MRAKKTITNTIGGLFNILMVEWALLLVFPNVIFSDSFQSIPAFHWNQSRLFVQASRSTWTPHHPGRQQISLLKRSCDSKTTYVQQIKQKQHILRQMVLGIWKVHAATAQPNQPKNAHLDVFKQHVDLAVNSLRNRFVKNRHRGCIYRQYMCEVCCVMYEPIQPKQRNIHMCSFFMLSVLIRLVIRH